MTDTNSENVLIDDAQFNFRARNVLRSWHFGKLPPLKTLGDIAKLTRAELLRTPNCGQVTLADIVQTLAEHNLCLKDEPMKTGKVVYERVADRIRVRELEEKNDRLLLELGYLQGKVAQVEALEAKVVQLEAKIEEHRVRENRAWDRYFEICKERDTTRFAASEAIRQLQVEIEHLRVSRETSGSSNS